MFDPLEPPAANDPLTAARRQMIVRDLERRGIDDARVLAAFAHVPRERFMPPEVEHLAYEDQATPIGHEQTISQPYIVALMTQALELAPEHRVLEIGTGSGYQTAILAELAREVYTVERIAELATAARQRLSALGYHNVHCLQGDGTLGYPTAAPYDRIMVTAGSDRVPEPLWTQLADEGLLVMPVGPAQAQQLKAIRKRAEHPEVTNLTACRFVPLLGAAGRQPPPADP